MTHRSVGCRYKYKINLPVHANRSIETMATLYDAVGNKIMTFRARKSACLLFFLRLVSLEGCDDSACGAAGKCHPQAPTDTATTDRYEIAF